jgi:hypothetical protein
MAKKMVQPKKASSGRLEKSVAEAVEDVCQFHRYIGKISDYMEDAIAYKMFTLTYGKVPTNMRTAKDSKHLALTLYHKLLEIAEKYPQNNSLKNKLDEAEKYIWPNGKR